MCDPATGESVAYVDRLPAPDGETRGGLFERPGKCLLRPLDQRSAEGAGVQQAVLADQDVLRLEIPVDDARPVRGRQALTRGGVERDGLLQADQAGPLRAALQSPDPMDEARRAIRLVSGFREQYRRVTALARAGR